MVFIPRIVLAVVLGICLAVVIGKARAEGAPFQAVAGNVTITVYDQQCTHPDQIKNLPNRATWKEGDKLYDGCVGVISQLGVAMFWFDDKSMAVVPLSMFHKVTEI